MACAAAWAWRANPVSREVRDGEPVALTWDGEPIAVGLFRTWDSVNDGQVRWTWDGIRKRLLIFNVHAALRRPLAVGEEVVVELKKDAWRGHVGLYLSDKPLPVKSMGSFGHREAFGGVNHLLFFHVDGDAVVEPSGWEAGVPLVIPEGSWTRSSPRQGLEPYVVSMQVLDAGLRWQVSLGGEVIALGNMDRPRGRPAYLHVYAFDNTLCYLGTLTRKRRNAGSSP